MSKKFLSLLLVLTASTFFASCSNPNKNEQACNNNKKTTSSEHIKKEESSINPLTEYPLVTYDDIKTGNYNGKNVCIECIIDKIDSSLETSCSFSLWYPSGDSYIYDSNQSFYDIKANSPEEIFLSAKNGDVIRYATTVHDDGSFGVTSLLGAEIFGNKELSNIYNSYKLNCPDIDYEDVLRNPQNHESSFFKITGSVSQIIDESPYSAEYLISTPAGYIYASWYENESSRGSRFLKGDNISLYGEFEMLKTYDTLIGSQNTVPQISVHFMDLQ